jgi:hypothetical protein
MHEINDVYTLNVAEQPDLERSSVSENTDHCDTVQRVFATVASHIKKLVGGLEKLELDLSWPGWKATPDPIDDLAQKLRKYGLCDNDIIVIDILSNSVVCGTNEHGLAD